MLQSSWWADSSSPSCPVPSPLFGLTLPFLPYFSFPHGSGGGREGGEEYLDSVGHPVCKEWYHLVHYWTKDMWIDRVPAPRGHFVEGLCSPRTKDVDGAQAPV
jgi:hypothetical protein